jgi:hypothetical protein
MKTRAKKKTTDCDDEEDELADPPPEIAEVVGCEFESEESAARSTGTLLVMAIFR